MQKHKELRALLDRAVRRQKPDGMLLSGGLDTTVLLHLLGERKLPAITVHVGKDGSDLAFAKQLARRFALRHTIIRLSFERLLAAMPETVRALKSFDPMTLRNNAVIHVALKRAKALGLKSVMTGDGGDEVFAGYRFIFEKRPRAMLYSLRKMWKIMRFSSHDLGKGLGVRVLSPFLEEGVRSFAQDLKAADFVTEGPGGRIGKAVVRRAVQGELPDAFVWRVKSPIQDGSGSTGLTEHLEHAISDAVFEKRRAEILERDGVRLRSKEQFHYYEMYRKIFGPPKPARSGKTACPDCGARVARPEGKFCGTCGRWPAC